MSSRRERLVRVPVACLAAAALVAPGFLAGSLLLPAGSLGLKALDHGLLLAGGCVAVLACWRVVRSTEGRDRRAWVLLATSLSCWLAGTFDYAVRDFLVSPSQLGAIDGEACYLLAVLLAFAAFPRFTREPAAFSTWGRRMLDALTVVSAASFVTWDVALRVILRHHAPELAWWTAFLYPLGDLVLVSFSVLVAAAAPARRRVSLTLLACAIAAFALSDTGVATLRSMHRYHDGALTDVGWMVGCLLGAAAASCFNTVRGEPSRRIARARAWRAAFLPYALVVPAASVMLADALLGRAPDAGSMVLGAIVLAFVLARQVLTIVENMRLVEQLTGREAELRRQASEDTLTGLANRRLFGERLEQALRERPPDEVAVLFVDIDDFKVVNDTLGHRTGDELLVKVGNRLVACVRGGDLPARLGGDEFAVLLTTGGLAAARAVASRLTKAMHQPVVCGNLPVFVRASLGIAVGTDASERTSQQLLERADMAMYAAKDAGKARVAVFEPAMRERMLDRATVQTDLTRALGKGELAVHYQPIVELSTGRIIGAEALLRWHHPKRGLVPPSVFIPLAEESGLIAPISRWVLRQACQEAASWQHGSPFGGYSVNVNVSAGQLVGSDVLDEVSGVLAETGLPGRLLTLEITESMLMADERAVVAQLTQLKTLGIRIAIDDFGTGFSGLSYIDRLPVDTLKVDKAFVKRLGEPTGRPPLAGAIVGLAELLSLDVVAEGIETAAQLAALVELGCRHGQGFHFSRPVPAEALRELLATAPARGALARQRRLRSAPNLAPHAAS
ncbi:MAG: putative bifunctional diguanylate cyclase/phosphodiesterase [Frankiaceae bacterium]